MALQGSRNGESLLADNMQDGVRICRDNPDSGVVVEPPVKVVRGIPVPSRLVACGGISRTTAFQPGAGNGEPVTAEVLAQRQAEEAIR